MATAECTDCGILWRWSARGGARLSRLKCSHCGGSLKKSSRASDRWRWRLGTSTVEILEDCENFLRRPGIEDWQREATELELDRIQPTDHES